MLVHEGHTDTAYSVAFSPDGNSIASGSFDSTLRVWGAHGPTSVGKTLRGHSDQIRSVAYSPLGNLIASGSRDRTIRLWDTSMHWQSGTLKGDQNLLSVAFSPNSRLIASGCSGIRSHPTANAVQLWDVQGRAPASGPFKGHTDWVDSISFSPDGIRLVSGSSDKTVRVWDSEHGTTILGPLLGHDGWVRSAIFSPNGDQIISCSWDHTLRLWDARSGELIGNPYQGHTNSVNSVSYSPSGIYVASGGKDTVRLWDIRTGRQVDWPFEEHIGAVYSVAFSPCGQYIASGSHDGKVIVKKLLDRDPDLDDDLGGPELFTSQMSIQEIFECLQRAGCVDLSSQMDTRQDTARIISGGGFGDIWLGQLSNGNKVAIKAWRTDALERCRYKTLKRAARELYYWSRMEHNNVHRLMGIIIFKDQYLGMVSEWMVNGNLHDYLRKHPEADRHQLCLDVASGLEYMHSQSTIHGDLKAANVLVTLDGVARLSDFDFSVLFQAGSLVFSESSNSRSGSIRWVAPEMFVEGAPTRTTQSDVYALGMEIFTGEVPYPHCHMDFNVIMAVTKGTLPTRPIDQLKHDDRGNLVWELLLRCWNRNVGERPSASQVVGVLAPAPSLDEGWGGEEAIIEAVGQVEGTKSAGTKRRANATGEDDQQATKRPRADEPI